MFGRIRKKKLLSITLSTLFVTLIVGSIILPIAIAGKIDSVITPPENMGTVPINQPLELPFGATFADSMRTYALIMVTYNNTAWSYAGFEAKMDSVDVSGNFTDTVTDGSLTLDAPYIMPENGTLSLKLNFTALIGGNHTFQWSYEFKAFQQFAPTTKAGSGTTYAYGTPPQLHLVVRGMDNRIYYNVWGSWVGWTVLPGATSDSPAATVLNGNLHLVVRGGPALPNTLWHGYVNLTTGTFSGWTHVPGATPSAPTLTADETNLYMVVRGMGNRIYYNTWTSGAWTGWIVLPHFLPHLTRTSDRPAATVLNNRLHMVVRGVLDPTSMWHGYVNLTTGVSSHWTLVPGAIPSAPTLAASATKLYLVVRGMGNQIYYNVWSSSWAGWTVLPGATSDSPAATVLNGNLHLVVRGGPALPNTLWHGYHSLTDGWPGWSKVPGATPSAPTIAA